MKNTGGGGLVAICLKISAMGKIYLNLHKYIVSRGHGGNAQFQFSFFVLVIEADCKSPYSVRVTKICVPKNPTVLYLPVLYSISSTNICHPMYSLAQCSTQ